MAYTFDSLVDEAVVRAPEVSTARMAAFLNERVGRMVADAEYSVTVRNLTATTVASQSLYSLDTDTIDLRSLRIGTDKYARATIEDIWELEADRASLDYADGKTGVFAPYSPTQIYIWPAPDTSGLSIVGFEVLYPSDSTYHGTDNMVGVIPKQVRKYLLDGIVADAYQASARLDLATDHEGAFENGVEKLRRLKNSRVGSGPSRIKLLR